MSQLKMKIPAYSAANVKNSISSDPLTQILDIIFFSDSYGVSSENAHYVYYIQIILLVTFIMASTYSFPSFTFTSRTRIQILEETSGNPKNFDYFEFILCSIQDSVKKFFVLYTFLFGFFFISMFPILLAIIEMCDKYKFTSFSTAITLLFLGFILYLLYTSILSNTFEFYRLIRRNRRIYVDKLYIGVLFNNKFFFDINFDSPNARIPN